MCYKSTVTYLPILRVTEVPSDNLTYINSVLTLRKDKHKDRGKTPFSCVKAYALVVVERHSFFSSLRHEGGLSASRSSSFFPWRNSAMYHLNRKLSWPQSRSGGLGKKTISCPCLESNHQSSVIHHIA